jgi:hypothetical protein
MVLIQTSVTIPLQRKDDNVDLYKPLEKVRIPDDATLQVWRALVGGALVGTGSVTVGEQMSKVNTFLSGHLRLGSYTQMLSVHSRRLCLRTTKEQRFHWRRLGIADGPCEVDDALFAPEGGDQRYLGYGQGIR